MPYNYSKLCGLIVEVFGIQAKFSQAVGLSERTVSLMLNNKVGWKRLEIAKCCDILGICATDISIYFFCNKRENEKVKKKSKERTGKTETIT